MCGICGKYSPDGVQAADLQPMLDSMAHRGPDDEGFYVNGRIGLGSRRLSVIDLRGGRQPISNEQATIWTVHNGEIYNYRELRRELEEAGHVFRTESDTEVIVHLYEEHGESCVEKLNGMFAFAIWDEKRQKLLLARDRIGQKPLFYVHDDRGFSFASELKGLLANGERRREIDFQSIHHFLSLRFIPPPKTMLRNFHKLPAAHVLTFQNGAVRMFRYWNLSFRNKLALPEEELMEALHLKLTQAVRDHLVSDVPVGAFLSGGMDSSMIVALMAGELGPGFKTFSIGVADQGFNERPYARMVAERYRTEHIDECVESDVILTLPEIVWHMDEPSDPIAACQFRAAALASRHVKVAVGGDGGDELFGGFDRYLGIGFAGHYARMPEFFRQHAVGPVLTHLPESFSYKSLTQQLRWVHRLSFLPGLAERYAEATLFFRFNHADKQRLFGPALWNQVEAFDSAGIIAEQFEAAEGGDDPVDKMLYADYLTRLAEHSLMLTDRMTMAHGLELRSPFLDHELVELMAAFPSNLKIRGGVLKYALRKLAAEYLPEAIRGRGKQGFMFPIAAWFRKDLHGFLERFLLESSFVRQGVFQKQEVRRLVEEHRRNRR
ncbi:MAG TPA: asparagine synthase (glutamine-hydrolyzing), partial [Acidobacteriota bacterium]|nr:asparagine synthase (glutamine-hydrolyzing) [Acidobacteriota bacterium]